MRALLILVSLSVVAAPATARAADVRWAAKDTAGREVSLPMRDKPAVVVFLRPGQAQSDDALEQVKSVLAKQPAATAVLVFSGPDNAAAGPGYAAARRIAWPVVLDEGYAIAGGMNVHAWPATVVVAADGVELARLISLPNSYVADLHAHLDFAAGKIDKAELDRRLAGKRVVAATTRQSATRFLIIARALLERGQLDEALVEIEQGLNRDPADAALRVERAKVLLMQKKFDAALAAADQLTGAVPAWQAGVLRAEALVALQRWADAKVAADAAIHLNPDPSRAHYLRGLIAAHDEDWKSAAESFRLGYEGVLRSGAKANDLP